MWPTQRLELLIGILVQFSIRAPCCTGYSARDNHWMPYSAWRSTRTEATGEVSVTSSFCTRAGASFQPVPSRFSAPPANKRHRKFLLCISFSRCESCSCHLPIKHRLLVTWKHHTPQNVCRQSVCTPEISQLHGWAINSSVGAVCLELQRVTRRRLGHTFQ